MIVTVYGCFKHTPSNLHQQAIIKGFLSSLAWRTGDCRRSVRLWGCVAIFLDTVKPMGSKVQSLVGKIFEKSAPGPEGDSKRLRGSRRGAWLRPMMISTEGIA